MSNKQEPKLPILLGNSTRKQLKKEAIKMVRQAKREALLWQTFFSNRF